MQHTFEHAQHWTHTAHRAAQAPCAVTLPVVDPLTQGLVGQTVRYKGIAKRLFNTPLPDIDPLTYHYEIVAKRLNEAVESGAIDTQETKAIIESFDTDTDPRYVLHLLQNKMDALAIADEMRAINQNVADIEAALKALGYHTDTLSVGSIYKEENTLRFELDNAIKVTIIDERNLPYPVQLNIAAIAAYFGSLCGTATEDTFVHHSEDFEALQNLSSHAVSKLKEAEGELNDSDFLVRFKEVAEKGVWNDFMEVIEDYYGYFIEQDDHHEDIANMVKQHIVRLEFSTSAQFTNNNTYLPCQGRALLKRTQRLCRQYAKHSCYPMLQRLVDLMVLAQQHYRHSTDEFTYLTDVYAMEYQQAVRLKSMEHETIDQDFSESEKHIMETGEYAQIAIDVEDEGFMTLWRNHQLGWLLLHCLEQTLSEYQKNV